jgi:hypothetical protein
VHAERHDDARVGDARRFVTEVQNMAIHARDGGPPPRLDRIAGPDRTGTAFALVDAMGRFVDIGLRPGWWVALGPARVSAGLLEALDTARLKAALVPMILRRNGHAPLSRDADLLDVIRGRLTDANRLIDDDAGAGDRPRDRPAVRTIVGPRRLFRLHVRGSRIDRAQVAGIVTAADTDRLVADARAALNELTGARWEP